MPLTIGRAALCILRRFSATREPRLCMSWKTGTSITRSRISTVRSVWAWVFFPNGRPPALSAWLFRNRYQHALPVYGRRYVLHRVDGKVYPVSLSPSAPGIIREYGPPVSSRGYCSPDPRRRRRLLTVSGVGPTSLTLTWSKGTDVVSAQATLQYEVRRSVLNNINTVANAEVNGTIVQNYTRDFNTLTVTGLNQSTTYFFNVIVRDEVGLRAAYVMRSQATTASPDTVPPAPGASGLITRSNIAAGSLTLTWAKATDNITAQNVLQYEVRLSTTNNITSVSSAEANGLIIKSYTPTFLPSM